MNKFKKFIHKIKKLILLIKKYIAENKYGFTLTILGIVTFLISIFITKILFAFLITALIVGVGILVPLLIKIIKRKKIGKKAYIEEIKDEALIKNNTEFFYDENNIEKKEGVDMKKKKNKKQKTKKKSIKIFKILLFSGLILCIIGIIAVIVFIGIIIKETPELNEEKFYTKEATILYDKDGEEIVRLGNEIRDKITYKEIPEILIDAIIATEDSRFFQHNGFDLPRFLKATFGQLTGKNAGGASTLTMQLAKNNITVDVYNKADSGINGIKRKFSDIYVSIFKLEETYTKEDIIELYVNSYNLGAGAYGVEQACLIYFGKSAKDISLSEAAMIAGLFQAPSAYNPYSHPEAAEDRRQTVLYLMERHGYITPEERKIAEAMTIDKLLVGKPKEVFEYQSFIDTVLVEVEKDTGLDPYSVPMLIYTTMDRKRQTYLDDMFNGKTFKWENDVIQAGIAVTDVNTGAIVAVGGGRNKDSVKSFNYATMTKRQIGSTAKPVYDYAPAIEYNGDGSGTIVLDDVHTYKDGNTIFNNDYKYKGFLTYREAVKQSRNIPALKVFQSVSKKKIKEFVTKLGLSPELEDGVVHEAHSIGGYNGESPLSMAVAYSAFANGGYYIEPYSYTKIIYRDTQEVYEQPIIKERAMSAETAYIVTEMLKSVGASMFGSTINGERFGVKTGTTNFSKEIKEKYKMSSSAVNDLWLVGISAEYSIALWYGYDEISSEYYSKTSTYRNKVWLNAAKGMIKKTSKDFPKAKGVVTVEIEKDCYENCVASIYTPEDMKTTEVFKSGTQPTEKSTRFAQLNNITNLTSSVNNNVITLNWTPIQTPDAINIEYITNLFSTLYSEKLYQTKLEERILYNDTMMGTVTYDIYLKDSNNQLTYIATTANPTYTYTVNSSNDYKFVIKSAYTIFKDNASNGAEINVNVNYSPELIVVSLNGNENITLNIGEQYTDPGLIITNNGIDVSANASVLITITNSAGVNISTIPNNIEELYTINYKITYKEKEYSLTRKVEYKNIIQTN